MLMIGRILTLLASVLEIVLEWWKREQRREQEQEQREAQDERNQIEADPAGAFIEHFNGMRPSSETTATASNRGSNQANAGECNPELPERYLP